MNSNKIARIFLFYITIILIGAIFYYSWLPNPSLNTEIYLPIWLRNWSNVYFNLRTAVPFVMLGFILEVRSGLTTNATKNSWKYNILFATIIVSIAEAGQFFTNKRQPDIRDVFYGIAGALTGRICYLIFIKLVKMLKYAEQT